MTSGITCGLLQTVHPNYAFMCPQAVMHLRQFVWFTNIMVVADKLLIDCMWKLYNDRAAGIGSDSELTSGMYQGTWWRSRSLDQL